MRTIKIILILALVLSMVIVFSGCNGEDIKLPQNSDAPTKSELEIDLQNAASSTISSMLAPGDYGEVKIGEDFDYSKISNYVRIDVAEYGSIFIELRPDVAPVTVNNFKRLALEGFYNGLTFHRVVKDFMIEGGELDSDGVIHDSEMIYGEFTQNNFTNNLPHVKGVISMSRKNIPDSASSGFFIVCDDAPQLDSRYAAFGYVIDGIEVLEAIENAEIGANNAPVSPIVIEKIIFMNIIVEG